MTEADVQARIAGLKHYTPEMHLNFHRTNKALRKAIDLWAHALIRADWLIRD